MAGKRGAAGPDAPAAEDSALAAHAQVRVQDLRIATPAGALFVRSWNPAEAAATPLVLLHDSLGCVELWRDFPARLAAATGRRVIAYDRLGFGRSDPHPGRLALDFIGDEAMLTLPALRRELGLQRFALFGHSVGGAMAISCAAAWPEDCQALVTESAQAFIEERTLAGIRRAQAQFARPGQLERLARYHGDKAHWVLESWTATWLSGQFRTWSLAHTLPRVRAPLLALHGDADEYGSVEHARHISRLTGGAARLTILSGCGHIPHRERPAEVLAAVSDFLDTQAAPGGATT